MWNFHTVNVQMDPFKAYHQAPVQYLLHNNSPDQILDGAKHNFFRIYFFIDIFCTYGIIISHTSSLFLTVFVDMSHLE